jgi:hypothetical protein
MIGFRLSEALDGGDAALAYVSVFPLDVDVVYFVVGYLGAADVAFCHGASTTAGNL